MAEQRCCGRLENVDKSDGRVRRDEGEKWSNETKTWTEKAVKRKRQKGW